MILWGHSASVSSLSAIKKKVSRKKSFAYVEYGIVYPVDLYLFKQNITITNQPITNIPPTCVNHN